MKGDLLRVVRSPAGDVSYDPTGRANGRGAYVCRDEACIATATARGPLSRTLEAQIPAGLRASLEAAAGIQPDDDPGGTRGQE